MLTQISYIYIIKNSVDGKIYLGSTNNPLKRKSTHFRELKMNQHHSTILQRAYNKYGAENFTFEIIKVCEFEFKLKIEQEFLDKLNPEYNMSKSSSAPMEFRKHKKETIEKMRAANRPKGPDSYLFGKTWTEERRNTLLSARKNSGYKHSNETKNKMSETAKQLNRGADLEKAREKQKKKIIDSSGNIFASLTECAKFWKISVATVCDILKGRHKQTSKGIIFNYV